MEPNPLVCNRVETVTAAAGHPAAPSRNRRALFWGLGGSLLSVAGFVALALFEQYNDALAELRTDLKRFNETSGEYVKKDQIQHIREQLRELYKDYAAAQAARAVLEQEMKASERSREELTREVQRTRERLAYLEGVRAATPATAEKSP